jgi:hypothetical protein
MRNQIFSIEKTLEVTGIKKEPNKCPDTEMAYDAASKISSIKSLVENSTENKLMITSKLKMTIGMMTMMLILNDDNDDDDDNDDKSE